MNSAALRLCLCLLISNLWAGSPDIVSTKRIWDRAPHSAFTDLTRYRDQWFCVFREGPAHVPVVRDGKQLDGVIRVISSTDGGEWTSAAVLSEETIDLRDPHFSTMPDGRLMMIVGGSLYSAGRYVTRQPRVAFSNDGVKWSPPQAVMEDGDWLWRVIWHQGRAYGVDKRVPGRNNARLPKRGFLVTSSDGITWTRVTELEVPGIDEAALIVTANEEMNILARRGAGNNHAWFGRSRPPYTTWEWQDCGEQVGGPVLVSIPEKGVWAGGRSYVEGKARTCLAAIIDGHYKPKLFLPSDGDNSYPGFWWYDEMLWISYYSSHEGKASVYLATVKINR